MFGVLGQDLIDAIADVLAFEFVSVRTGDDVDSGQRSVLVEGNVTILANFHSLANRQIDADNGFYHTDRAKRKEPVPSGTGPNNGSHIMPIPDGIGRSILSINRCFR
jgi:hypothetical protein